MTQIDWKYPSRDGWPPDEGEEYLVTTQDKNGVRHADMMLWRNNDDAECYFEAPGNENIIAWAEMPEPAKPLD